MDVPASIAGLPASNACVCVGPPLSCRLPIIASAPTIFPLLPSLKPPDVAASPITLNELEPSSRPSTSLAVAPVPLKFPAMIVSVTVAVPLCTSRPPPSSSPLSSLLDRFSVKVLFDTVRAPVPDTRMPPPLPPAVLPDSVEETTLKSPSSCLIPPPPLVAPVATLLDNVLRTTWTLPPALLVIAIPPPADAVFPLSVVWETRMVAALNARIPPPWPAVALLLLISLS